MIDLGKVTRHEITDREQWMAMRAKDLTASEVPSWCGCGYDTPLALYGKKKGRIAPMGDNPLLRKARWFEPAIAEALCEYRPKWKVRRSRIYLRSESLRFGCTKDMLAIDPSRPGIGVIEGKVIARPSFHANWQTDESSNEITAPVGYQLQTIAQRMLVAAATGQPTWAALVALVHDTYSADLVVIDIPHQPETEDYILDQVACFWHCFDNDLDPAVDPLRDTDTVKKLYPESNGTEIDLSADNEVMFLVDQREVYADGIRAAEKNKKAIDTALRGKIGAAERARLADGRLLKLTTVNCKEQVRAAYSYRRLDVLKGNGYDNG